MSNGDTTENAFGRFIKIRRLERQLTLRKFADEIGVSPTYVSGFENGTIAPPTPERLLRISQILTLDYEELLTLARRWEDAIPPELDENPKLLTLYRTVRTMAPAQLAELQEKANEIKKGDDT